MRCSFVWSLSRRAVFETATSLESPHQPVNGSVERSVCCCPSVSLYILLHDEPLRSVSLHLNERRGGSERQRRSIAATLVAIVVVVVAAATTTTGGCCRFLLHLQLLTRHWTSGKADSWSGAESGTIAIPAAGSNDNGGSTGYSQTEQQ